MSESEVRWGVKISMGGRRQRVTSGGQSATYDLRKEALRVASLYDESENARLVKLTRRAKGWRPASEPPRNHPGDKVRESYRRQVLVRLPPGVGTMAIARCDVCSNGARIWHVAGHTDSLPEPTHWRELPLDPVTK